MSAFWRTVYFLRAVIWMVLQVVLGVVATVFELLTLPIFYFLDPTHRVYQYTVCTIAQMGLYPFITVEVKVGALPSSAAGPVPAALAALSPPPSHPNLPYLPPSHCVLLRALSAGYYCYCCCCHCSLRARRTCPLMPAWW